MRPSPDSSLPTVLHWYRAAGANGIFSDVLQVSNFGGRGPLPVGASGSLGPFGTADMAGNVKEWVWNESTNGRRFVLGGGWFEAAHSFIDEDARAPFTRDPGFGFRCMRQDGPADDALARPLLTPERSPAVTPVGDDVYQGYRRLYDYDARPLDGRVDERDDTQPQWMHRARVVHRRLWQRPAADDADAAQGRQAAVPGGGLFPGLRRGALPDQPRRQHLPVAVPAGERPSRGVPDLPADLRAPPGAHGNQFPARDQRPARPGSAPGHRLPGDPARHRRLEGRVLRHEL